MLNLIKGSTPVFIIGSGRSGTTLLLKILNSVPEVCIWGEHGWFLKDIAKSYFLNLENDFLLSRLGLSKNSLTAGLEKIKNPKIFSPWVNWFSKIDLSKNYAGFIESLFNPDKKSKAWGFKEITYGNDDRVLDFLIDIFPEAKFVFLVRNPVSVVTSQVFNFDKGNKEKLETRIKDWVIKNRNLYQFYQKYRANCFIIKYEDLINKNSKILKLLFNFLGFELTKKQYEVIDLKEGRGETGKKNNTKEEEEKIKIKTNEIAFKYGYGSLPERIWSIKSDKYKFAYVPIPKNACTTMKISLAKFLGIEQKGDPHEIKFEFANLLDKKFKDYFSFTFVRNPWDRLLSCYMNKIKNEAGRTNGYKDGILSSLLPRYGDAFHAKMPFEEFVEKISEIPDEKSDEHFRSQYTFVYDKKGNKVVDFVGRFENFDKDFDFISEKIGHKLEKFYEGKTKHKPYQEYYNEKTKELITKRYKKDIEIFGYEFGK